MFIPASSRSKQASLPRVIPPAISYGNHIDKHDAGLKGAEGAEVIVKLLRSNSSVKHLVLGHNELGDDGCVLLFDYLRSEAGRRHQVTEISLNANKIGDAGLWTIARYLEDNKSLTALFLQNNAFQGDRPIMLRFVLALNRSNLRTLSLTCNPSLVDVITSTLLPNLSSARLSELHLSVCSLGPSTTPSLLSYLSSPRSQALHMLKLNGNPLGITSVARIVSTLERSNWSIGWLEMHACSHDAPVDDKSWNVLGTQLRIKVLERNRFLRQKVEEEALILLPCARAFFLTPSRVTSAPHARLPTELLQYILSFVAPSLSIAQHLRVSTYAASMDTLPSVGLTMPQAGSSAPLSGFEPQHTCVEDQWGFPMNDSGKCAACARNQRAMSPLRKQGCKKTWLNRVGCDRFEALADPVQSVYEEQPVDDERTE